jgi:1,2-diacylglycerol-3-alpha-glucose alpha-1,2-galactosyltransferase
MSILEAASCGAPVMLRDLDLYKNILEGKYLAGKDFDEMNKILQNFAQNPKLQAEMRAKSAEISEYYSEDRLLKIWIDFYREQAKNK